MSEVKVHVYRDPASGAIALSFVKSDGGQRYIAKPIVFEWQPLTEGQLTQPTLTLPNWEGEEILHKLADQLDSFGVKTDTDHRIAGTLEATRAHLADLRKLLKIDDRGHDGPA